GEVYLCLDLETIQPYALKTFQQRYQTGTQRLRQAFEKEVATWVALEKHPNIVRCFYLQTLDNQPFMILEWIAGEEGKGTDLRGWLRHGPLDLQLALDLSIDVCRGLIHAQEKQPGLVHRDLKPENILVAQGRWAKITDFGLADIIRQAGMELDAAGTALDGRQSIMGQKGIAGTPAYMAPEQWRGESLDERADVYALGCILYEMLTGEQPFQVSFRPTTRSEVARWLREMQAQHENSPIPVLPASLPAAPGDL
ncbi:MAG: serine/threonine protein kinase, partial [Delftia sp.]|nr:serine/threonine protein kinase [Delftia sp.]